MAGSLNIRILNDISEIAQGDTASTVMVELSDENKLPIYYLDGKKAEVNLINPKGEIKQQYNTFVFDSMVEFNIDATIPVDKYRVEIRVEAEGKMYVFPSKVDYVFKVNKGANDFFNATIHKEGTEIVANAVYAKIEKDNLVILDHSKLTNNPHQVTKYQVGLGKVGNFKQASKVEFDDHKGDVDAHVTKAEKDKLAGIEEGAQRNTVTKVAGKTGDVQISKSDVGLSQVKNVEQASKTEFDELESELGAHVNDPSIHVSSSEKTEWGDKYDKPVDGIPIDDLSSEVQDILHSAPTRDSVESHTSSRNNPHQVTKAQIGLGSVDNIKQATKQEFDTHKNDTNNPHNTTKGQVGLGNVPNYGIASQAEAEGGTVSNKFMSPLRTKQAIDNKLGDVLNHIGWGDEEPELIEGDFQDIQGNRVFLVEDNEDAPSGEGKYLVFSFQVGDIYYAQDNVYEDVIFQFAFDVTAGTQYTRNILTFISGMEFVGNWSPFLTKEVRNVAIGADSEASGSNSIALGRNSEASGSGSAALGRGSTASEFNSVALGLGSEASGSDSIALGRGSAASGSGSAALGRGSTASEFNSVALGLGSEASGNNSVALGFGSVASGNNSVALGRDSEALNIGEGVLGGATILSPNKWIVPGDLTVEGTKNFEMPHPNPDKRDTHRLRHSAVESPTAGDNLYRFSVEAREDNETVELQLPDYFQYLNKDVDVWVNGYKHFGRAFGVVEGDKLQVTCESAGRYNVLVIGTRKDDHQSVIDWDIKGVEREIGESWTGETYVFEVDEFIEVEEIEEVI